MEYFYKRIDKQIKLIAAYIESPSLIKIIKSCRLKPYTIFSDNFQSSNTKLERHWVDEFGNSLIFEEKISRIIVNDTSTIEYTKTSTDLFFANPIQTTIKNSSFAFVADGNHLDKPFYIIALYGNDEYLRAYIYTTEWNRISPLLLGIKTLNSIFENMNSAWINKIENLEHIVGLELKTAVTTMLPTRQDIKDYFNNDIIIDNIKGIQR